MSEARLRAVVLAVSSTIVEHAEELTALDAAIGDGDHGVNMRRGAAAVVAELEAIVAKPLPEALKTIGTRLVMTVGGASGPLYGTLCLALGKQLSGTPDDFAGALRRAVDAVAARGKSRYGQKTLLDVLYPIVDAVEARRTLPETVAVAHAAAAETRDRKALRGRASFLGDRSIGHVDPGARSSALIVEAIAGALL
ncbi:MAG: dihydroxyacetone kinase subunit L [Devosia sp.]|nr:dihydroxyacetone kinase subunit L [Devosia sp.]